MRRPSLRIMTSLLLVVMLLSAHGGGRVSAAQTEYDPEIAAALDRIADGTYTSEDLALIRRHPEIAAHVPDPTRPEVVGITRGTMPKAALVGTISLSSCPQSW